MSDLQIIHSVLEESAQRLRWQRAWKGFWIGFLVGAAVWLLALALYKVLPVPFEILTWSALGGAIFALTGFAVGWHRVLTRSEMARWLDLEVKLQERLSTAMEVSERTPEAEWNKLIFADAARSVGKVKPRELLPLKLPPASRWALMLLAMSVGLGFVPEYRSEQYVQKKRDAEIVKDVGKHLTDLTRRSLEARPPVLQPTQKAMEAVGELGQKLERAQLSRTEALHDVASVTDRIKEQLKELGKDPAIRRMEQAARTPGGQGTQDAAGLQKQMESLQKQLGDKATDPAKLDKLQKDLEKLKKAAAGMADKSAADGSAAREQVSQSLSTLVKQAQDLGLQIPGLEQAMAALAANQTDNFMKDLDLASTDLEKLKEMAKALQQMQALSEKMGKDLAEQLKFGQAEAAMGTLQKMMQQLKEGNLSKEELQKMMQEVSKAIDPAGKFGQCAQCLKSASDQLGKNDKSGASQSLANAKKELEQLMGQMSDAKSLMASLEALDRASMCLGTCQNFGQGQGPPKSGQGGKPGKGVGTWADEEGWQYYPEITDRWDNSGIVRPDMDGRGQTDRGDGSLSDKLAPTKIRGQIAPGSQMPSITLKGVSIKGTSSVGFEESATAAQSEAQSALSQEKVPRAYQNAVKDYFDDLKK